jgi:hypothetical protein
VLGFANQAQQRKRMVFIGLGIGTVVVGLAAVGVMKYGEAKAARRVVETYGSLTRCLLGDAPQPGEAPSLRVRGMQLSALTQFEVTRAADKSGPWPDRCAKYAHGLHEAIGDSSIAETKGKPLAEAAKALADALDQKDGYWRDASAVIDRAFTEAATAGVVLNPRNDVPAPPERAKPLDADTLAKTGALTEKPMSLADVHVQASSRGEVRFVIDDAKAGIRRLCTVTADAARCAPLAGALKTAKAGLRILGTHDDGAEPLLASSEAAYASAGDKLIDGSALGAQSSTGGRVTMLVEATTGLELKRMTSGTAVATPVSLGSWKLAEPRKDARILWDQVVAIVQNEKETALAASPADGASPKLEVIGVLPKVGSDRGTSSDPRLDGCQSNGVTVARARLGRDEYLSFFVKGAWTAPLKLTRYGATLYCHAGQAILMQVEGGSGEASLDATLSRQQCSPTECRVTTLSARDLYAGEVGLASSTPLALGNVDGKALVAWQSGQRGGLRLRLGALDKLGGVPDVIVYDDLVQGGKVVDGSTILDMRLLSAERFAVLLLVTPSGLRALRIGSDGKTLPVTL